MLKDIKEIRISVMAFTCSSAVSHAQINGHYCFLKHGRAEYPLSSAKIFQKRQNNLALMWSSLSACHKVMPSATLDEGVQENSNDSKEESIDSPPKQASQISSSEAPSSSSPGPFVGAKISSRIASRTSKATNNTTPASAAPSPVKSPRSAVAGPASKPSISVAEKLKSAKEISYLEPKASSKERTSKNILDALKRADLQGKTTKFGQPVVPTNLFDEPRMPPAENKKFEFTLNRGQLVLVFSFLTIAIIMFGTTYVVWKLGGIHYNEY